MKSLIRYSKQKKSTFKILMVISNNPDAKGLKFAKEMKIKNYGIKYKDRHSFEKKTLKLLKKFNVDLICLAGFMKILSANFIKKFSKPILNIHPSLLPKYKGLNTHEKVFKNRDKFTGATIHKVTSKLDSGKIILQKKVKIFKNDTEKKLAKRVLKQEHFLFPKALDLALSNL